MKLRIRGKLMLGFGVVIAIMVLSNAYILFELYDVSTTTATALTADARAVDLANQLHATLNDEESYIQKFVVSRDSAYFALATESGIRFAGTLDSLAVLAAQRPLLRRPVHEMDRAHSWLQTHVPSPPVRSHESDSSTAIHDIAHTASYIHATLDQVAAYSKNSITESLTSVQEKTRDSSLLALLLTTGTLLIAVILAVGITRTITSPLATLMDGTQQIASGSFNHIRVPSRDEIAQLAAAFNLMSDRLKAINEYKAEMMQHISHEIRSPLQLMLTSHFLLTERNTVPLDEHQQRLLRIIRESIDRISRFADAFLDLSKIEAGMMEYNFTSVDMAALVRKAVEDASILASERTIDVRLVADEVPPIIADADKCAHVVSNLLNNALKYTGGGGQISVTLAPCASGIRFGVGDTGPGIAKEDLPKIFTKFYRTRTAVRGKKKGTGLGLALVKALVEGHGGRVAVTSELGIGSTFTVELPLVPSATDLSS